MNSPLTRDEAEVLIEAIKGIVDVAEHSDSLVPSAIGSLASIALTVLRRDGGAGFPEVLQALTPDEDGA
jgi:hypothetical protein